jgi:pyridoxal/pyridoxine/pyridoxamine kinase
LSVDSDRQYRDTKHAYELGWLSGAELADSASVVAAAETLGPARVLVTSAPAMMAGSTGNLLISGGAARDGGAPADSRCAEWPG